MARRTLPPGARTLIPAVVVGLLATGCGAGSPPQAPPVASGAPAVSAAFLQACPDRRVGDVRRAAAGRDAALPGPGSPVPLRRLPPAPHVINLWASWCAPCRVEAPRLRAAAQASSGRVQFLGIDIQDGRQAALSFLSDFGIDYPQLADRNGDVLHQLGAPGIPVTLVVDATGRIVYRRIGEISDEQLAAAMHAADPNIPLPTAK